MVESSKAKVVWELREKVKCSARERHAGDFSRLGTGLGMLVKRSLVFEVSIPGKQGNGGIRASKKGNAPVPGRRMFVLTTCTASGHCTSWSLFPREKGHRRCSSRYYEPLINGTGVKKSRHDVISHLKIMSDSHSASKVTEVNVTS